MIVRLDCSHPWVCFVLYSNITNGVWYQYNILLGLQVRIPPKYSLPTPQLQPQTNPTTQAQSINTPQMSSINPNNTTNASYNNPATTNVGSTSQQWMGPSQAQPVHSPMQVPSLLASCNQIRPNLITLLERELEGVPADTILYLCRKIYPVQISTPNAYNSLYRTLIHYFVIQVNKDKNITYQSVIGEVLKIASYVDTALSNKLNDILKHQYVKSKILDSLKKNLSVNTGSSMLTSNPNSTPPPQPKPNTSPQYTCSVPKQKKSYTINTTNYTNPINPITAPNTSIISAISTQSKYGSTLLENLGVCANSGSGVSAKYANQLGKELNDTFKRDKGDQDISALIAQKYIKQKTQIENLLPRLHAQKILSQQNRIPAKKCILCDTNLSNVSQQNFTNLNAQRNLFRCKDCGELFHRKCVARDNNCGVCQLRNMNPLVKTKCQLFVGILKKGTKKHEIQFELTKAHTASQTSQQSSTLGKQNNTPQSKKPSTFIIPTIQLRSLRLKSSNDPVSNFINLFPDACTIMVNNRLIKQFQPLHKQSSLKYRRDQSIKISNNCNIGINRIVVTERIMKKDIKPDERIQPESHLVGVYLVESLQVPRIGNKLQQFLCRTGYVIGNGAANIDKFLENVGCRVSQFTQSERLLKENLYITDKKQQSKPQQSKKQQFKSQQPPKAMSQLQQIMQIQKQLQAQEEQEISCQSIKIPLTCSLTLQKMKYPGRTIFCKHFACFDIFNFILLNSQAKIPKWQCPICKASAYKFQIDCIVNSIIMELNRIVQSKKANSNSSVKEQEEAGEIQFCRDFSIKFINGDGSLLINKKGKLSKDKLKNKEKDKVKKSKFKNYQEILQTQFVPYWIQNIYDLPVQGKNKRMSQAIQQKPKDKYRQKQKQTNKQQKDKKKQKSKEKQKQKQKLIEEDKNKQKQKNRQKDLEKQRIHLMQKQHQIPQGSQKQKQQIQQRMIDQNQVISLKSVLNSNSGNQVSDKSLNNQNKIIEDRNAYNLLSQFKINMQKFPDPSIQKSPLQNKPNMANQSIKIPQKHPAQIQLQSQPEAQQKAREQTPLQQQAQIQKQQIKQISNFNQNQKQNRQKEYNQPGYQSQMQEQGQLQEQGQKDQQHMEMSEERSEQELPVIVKGQLNVIPEKALDHDIEQKQMDYLSNLDPNIEQQQVKQNYYYSQLSQIQKAPNPSTIIDKDDKCQSQYTLRGQKREFVKPTIRETSNKINNENLHANVSQTIRVSLGQDQSELLMEMAIREYEQKPNKKIVHVKNSKEVQQSINNQGQSAQPSQSQKQIRQYVQQISLNLWHNRQKQIQKELELQLQLEKQKQKNKYTIKQRERDRDRVQQQEKEKMNLNQKQIGESVKQQQKNSKQKQKERIMQILKQKISRSNLKNNLNNNPQTNEVSSNLKNSYDPTNQTKNTSKNINSTVITYHPPYNKQQLDPMTKLKGKKFNQDLLYKGYNQSVENQKTNTNRNYGCRSNTEQDNKTPSYYQPPQQIHNQCHQNRPNVDPNTNTNLNTNSSIAQAYLLRNKQKKDKSNSGGSANINKNQAQRQGEKSNRRSTNNAKQFVIPNDADVIELSD